MFDKASNKLQSRDVEEIIVEYLNLTTEYKNAFCLYEDSFKEKLTESTESFTVLLKPKTLKRKQFRSEVFILNDVEAEPSILDEISETLSKVSNELINTYEIST